MHTTVKPATPTDATTVLRPDNIVRALNALSGGVTAYVYGPASLTEKRAAVIQMSFLLRRAFSVRDTGLERLPLQLGADFEAARTYVSRQARIWAHGEDLSALFAAANLNDLQSQSIRAHFPSLIPLDEAAIWVCREFGDLRAERKADHCRRYVATWMSRAILGETGKPPVIGKYGANELQIYIDGWANPVASIEASLHFERVIQPHLKRIAEIARQAPVTVIPFPANDAGDRS